MDKQYKVSSRERVYDFIVDYIQEHGYSPSIKEICSGTNLKSTSSVYSYILKLEEEGKLEKKPNTRRAIKVIELKFVKKSSR